MAKPITFTTTTTSAINNSGPMFCWNFANAYLNAEPTSRLFGLPPIGGVYDGPGCVTGGCAPGARSGGYHFPSDASHQPGPCDSSLTRVSLRRGLRPVHSGVV